MDVSTSPKLTSLLQTLRHDYPGLAFVIGDISRWSPDEKTIYIQAGPTAEWELLHELAHALLGHSDFTSHTTLVRLEVSAWQYARDTLGASYNIAIDANYIETALTSYRHWLEQQATCPSCGASGMQQADQSYYCLGCTIAWNTNDARQTAGRRYIV